MTRSVEGWSGRVRSAFAEVFGEDAVISGVSGTDDSFGPVTVDVPEARWVEAATLARDGLDCTFFDWLSAVDELDEGFRVACHVADHRAGGVEHLVVRTLVPRGAPMVSSLASVYAGARWHERETHEMFGVDFTEDGSVVALDPLLLPEEFEGHPLRKEFVLASRVAKPWPGAKEPGESDHGGPSTSRRRIRPPGVPEPDQWGPRRPTELSGDAGAGTPEAPDKSAGGGDA